MQKKLIRLVYESTTRLTMLKQKPYIDKSASQKICLYHTNCVPYVADLENSIQLLVAWKLYKKFSQYPQAMRFAMQLNNLPLIEVFFIICSDL